MEKKGNKTKQNQTPSMTLLALQTPQPSTELPGSTPTPPSSILLKLTLLLLYAHHCLRGIQRELSPWCLLPLQCFTTGFLKSRLELLSFLKVSLLAKSMLSPHTLSTSPSLPQLLAVLLLPFKEDEWIWLILDQ